MHGPGRRGHGLDAGQRIEQWEKMTREVPDGMAWFSLGNAYRDAGRDKDAVEALGLVCQSSSTAVPTLIEALADEHAPVRRSATFSLTRLGPHAEDAISALELVLDDENRYVRWLISGAVGFFLALMLWGVVEFFSTDHPEMEAFKCDNPNCGQIHYRSVTKSN